MESIVTPQKLQLNQIMFGKTDAFNELLQLGPDYFIDSFVENRKYQKKAFLSGDKFYIVGKKGTGKTAFLRYLECQLDSSSIVIPIRFKSDFDDLDKEQFVSVIDSELIPKEGDGTDFTTKGITSLKSYVLMWKTFLINQIVLYSQKGEYSVFDINEKYKLMVSLLKALFGENHNEKRIMPKLRKGTIELNGSVASGLSAGLKLEIDFEEKTKKVNYLKLSKLIVQLFSELVYSRTPVFVLVDELELSIRNKDMHEKDITLVRDLILAIDELNKICRTKQYAIHLIASIRSEVVSSVLSAGFEINKSIEDYGVSINWFQKGGNYTDNPLLKMVERKIRASERINGINSNSNVWETYFENTIHNMEVRKFILTNIWYRPRDVVRLMTLLQTESLSKERFDQEAFDRAQQEYSNRMWTEFSEELRLTYSPDDLSAIKTFFTKIPIPFTYKDLLKRADSLSDIYPNIKAFFEKESMAVFLEKMFSIGIIGNTGERMVFSFLGDQEISLLDPMVIHNPLRNYFAVQHAKSDR